MLSIPQCFNQLTQFIRVVHLIKSSSTNFPFSLFGSSELSFQIFFYKTEFIFLAKSELSYCSEGPEDTKNSEVSTPVMIVFRTKKVNRSLAKENRFLK